MARPDKSAVNIRREATCPGGAAPSGVTLLADWNGTIKSYAMILTTVANGYQATIPVADINSNATLSVKVNCAGSETTTSVGSIQLYDPSGLITDATTGQPITTATVTLYRVPSWVPKQSADDTRDDTCQSNSSKATDADWDQPAPTALGALVNPAVDTVSPAVNYMATDNAGRYGWDVGQGCWYVVVTAPDYEPLVSPVVGVPPAVTNLDLALVRTEAEASPTIYLPLIQR